MRKNLTLYKKQDPKYLQVAQWLEEKIQKAEYKVGEQLPGEAAFAKKLTVSTITVRQAFELLRERGLVTRVPYQGTFVAENKEPASSPRPVAEVNGHNKNILVLAAYCDPEPKGVAFPSWKGRQDQIRASFEKEVSSRGYRCVGRRLVRSESTPAFEANESQNYDAAILLSDTLTQEEQSRYVGELTKAKIPYVVTDYFGQLPSNRVQENLILGMEEALGHLEQLGHSRVGLLTFDSSSRWGEEWPWLRIRLDAFRHGVLQRDWVQKEEDILSLSLPKLPPGGSISALQQDLGETLARRYQQQIRESDCTAWVAINDRVALGFLAALKRQNPELARRLSVVGFDNELGAQEANLTTVASPSHEMGAGAARLLLDLMNSHNLRHVRTLDFSPNLMRRSSTHPVSHFAPEQMTA
jgi:DNA-binding LacI/PurR family transcriptional regulator/DNA-binding transcriptional regulator YhcF (GntR family)